MFINIVTDAQTLSTNVFYNQFLFIVRKVTRFVGMVIVASRPVVPVL